jgi:hypothetical protein
MPETGQGAWQTGSPFVNSAFPLGTYPTVHYEPTRRENEDRAAFLDRFRRINEPSWRAILTPAEWGQIWHHVSACDFPETASAWCELGRDAGFAEARRVFVDRGSRRE